MSKRGKMEYGILIRESFTKGKMFISDNVIIGQALVDAFVLENTKQYTLELFVRIILMCQYF